MRMRPGLFSSAAALAVSLWSAAGQAQDGATPGIPTAREVASGENDGRSETANTQAEPIATASPQADQGGGNPLAGQQIEFTANLLEYNSNGDIITALGDVLLQAEDRSLRAESVVWNRTTGEIAARGQVRLVDENGNQLLADSIDLTDAFEAGTISNLLVALGQGGRVAAREGARNADGTLTLTTAAYTSCAVVDENGEDICPTWRITADQVVYDPAADRLRFRGAAFHLFGRRILPLPGLSINTDGSAASGFFIPDLRISRNNGVEISGSYYWRLAPNRDLTAGAHLFTDAPPMASAQWRHLTELGAYQITGYLTGSRRIDVGAEGGPQEEDALRGYIFANGRFQLDPNWSITTSIRRASDRTFLRRYDLSREDRLRSMVEAERITGQTYFSLAGWNTQTLRLNAPQGQQPVALPVLDYRRRIPVPRVGGEIDVQLNTLAIGRTQGQDTQRAFAAAQWSGRTVTPMGQRVTLTALGRADVYHTDDILLTETPAYRGDAGVQARAIGLAALDVEWPLVGPALGGTQVLTPRMQLVATPPIRNLAVPNEDSRAFDLEDTNLFSLNRFPGYDRIEDGVRLVYGVDWRLERPQWLVQATLGQSIRLSGNDDFLIDGTGISEQVSDIVGRTEVRYRDFLKVTHRFRIDKDSLALRRNEFDATIGSPRTYVEVGYLRLDRDIANGFEDLQDREELRFAGRVRFAQYWSLFGSGNINLTDAEEDPTLTSDGFQPIRTRLGVAYEDDCLEMGLTWRRDYVTAGDARQGNTFQLFFALKNLGFR